MAAKGTLGKGTTIGHGTVQAGPYTLLANIRAVSPPHKKWGSADTTCFTDSEEQSIIGWLNGGSGKFTLLYITANATLVEALVNTVLWWQITLPDTHTITFEGFIDEVGIPVPLKEGITQEVSIKVTTSYTYA